MAMKMAVESMEMLPGAIPRPGTETETSVPRISSATVAALWNFSWISERVLRVFPRRRINRRTGEAGRHPGGPHHAQARASPRARQG